MTDPISSFDLASAELRLAARDAQSQAEWLAASLSRLLPDHTRVTRATGFFGGDKGLKSVQVTLGEHSYRLELQGRQLATGRTHRVGGIDLNTEPLALPDWLRQLSAAVREEAGRNSALHEALERFNRSGEL